MKPALRLLFAMALALGAPLPLAHAQVINAVVVSSCGTPPQTYTAGQFQPLLVDTTGAFCVSSSGGGGGAVTLAAGAVHAGAYVAGSVLAGAFADGAITTLGSTTDAPCTLPASTTACSQIAIEKAAANGIVSGIPTQAPTISIGGVGIVDSAGTNVATVKAASTLPVAADKTLVVGLNPGTATAGSPTGAIVTVQGVSGGQAIPISGALTANQSVNVAQIGGTNTVNGGVAGILSVGGNVANAVTATSNPVPTGGVFTTTPATLTTGQTATRQFTAAQNAKDDLSSVGGTATGALLVAPSTAPVTATNTALTVDLRPDSPGIIPLGQAVKASSVPVTFASDQDPCSYAQKSSVKIAITTATTTAMVAVSGSTTVYVCGFDFTISNVVTTANTLKFESGTGTACATPVADLTGIYNAGGITAAAPTHVQSAGTGGGTVFNGGASNGVCAVTAIGATAAFEGVLTYVQQ